MRIVSEGGITWGVITEDGYHKTYVPLNERQMRTLSEVFDGFIEEPHGPTCTCFPCEQATYRMDRDDPSVGGYAPTN